MGFEFKNTSEPFSVYNATQALVAFMFLSLESLLPEGVEPINYYNLYYIIFCAIVAFAGCSNTYFFEYNEKLSHVKKRQPASIKKKFDLEEKSLISNWLKGRDGI